MNKIVEHARGFDGWSAYNIGKFFVWLSEWINASCQASPALLNEFSGLNGYMLIRDALANLEAHSSTRDKKGTLQCVDKILYASWRLATAGKDAPTVPAKSEYNQHIIDAYKSSSGTFNDDSNCGAGSKDAIKKGLLRKPICNDKPFLYLQDFLLNSRWEEAQIRVLGLIRKVFQANPVNILLLERSVMFGVVFSHLGSFSRRVCDEVINTIVPTVQSTKWVLSSELEPLGVLLGEMDLLADPCAPSVLSLIERLSELNNAHRVLFSRTKVLNSLLDAFVRAHDKADPQDPQHGERLSLGIRALGALENMCPQNVQSISPVHGRVLKCIGIKECRQASIGFWKQLLVQDHSGLQRNFDTFVEGFGRLIPSSDTPLKIDVLMMLCFIVQHSVSCKDVFRNNGGFDTLASIMGKFRCPGEEEEEGDAGDTAAALEALNLFEAVVALIVSAICYYDLNRKFFVSTIGFAIVENVISHARLLRSATPLRVLDSLIALTTECLDIGTVLSSDIDQEENDNEETGKETVKAKSKKSLSDRDSVDIINPQALIIGVRHIQEVDLESALTFLRKVSALVRRVSNKHNVGSSGVLGAALDVLLSIWNAMCKVEGRCVPPDTLLSSNSLFRGLVDLVVVLGRHGFSPDELAKLLRLVRGEWGVSPAPAFPEYRGKDSVGGGRPPNEGMLEVLRLVCDEGRAAGVPAVEFDMSTGSACVQVEFCAAWPPPGGYTFTAWVRIDALSGSGGGSVDIMGFHMHDLKMRTTLYADATGALCFRMGERDALPLGVTLRPGVWYHLAFLYPRTVIRSANAVLYVDAMLAWSGRLPHMANASPPFMLTIGSLPGSGNGRGGGCGGDGGKGAAVKWRAGPCYLFEKLLTPNSITALYLLGNTFDKSSLGSVSDFVASNTSIDATRRMAVVRSDSGTVREYDISTIGALDFAAFQMALCLSGQSESEYDSGRELCIMNSAALSGEHRAQLFGACQSTNVCTVPRCIERLGGVFVAFPLVARATSPRGLLLGLQTLVGLVRGNRSNYLEMERSGGYQILAMILSQKAALLTTEHMNVLFSFVGFFPPETPASERAIMNKAAFKFLFLHLTTWKETRDVALLTTVLGIFKELVATSAYSTFNAIQMHAVQTVSVLYIQLRDEKLPKEAVTAIFEVIEALCAKSSYAKDDLSHLTGFALSLVPTVILDDDTQTSSSSTSSFVEDADGLGSESGAKSEEHPGDTPRSTATDESRNGGADGAKRRKEMSPHALFTCKKAMETVFRLLVSEECGANLPELLHPYWIFHFLVNDTSSEIVCEALLILAAQYNTTGVSCKFVEAFRKACGFKILHRLMLYRCTQPAVYYPLMCLMLGADMRMVPRTLDFDCYDLIAKFKRDELKVAVPEVIPILFGMLKCAYEVAISSNVSAPDGAALASGNGATSGNGDSAGKSNISKVQKTFSFSHNPNNSISGSVVNVGVANEPSEELDPFTMTQISGHSKTSSITSSSVALSQMAKAKRGNGNANVMSGSGGGGNTGGNSGGNSNSSHGKWWKKFKNTLNLRGSGSSNLYSLRSISNFWDRRARKISREDEEAAPQVVQTLVKFIMLVFTSCKEFQEQLFASQEALGRFVAVFFPHGTVCIPDTGKAGRLTMAESSILLLYHLLIQGLEERLRLNPKGMVTLEAALLDAVPTGVAEKDARYYQSVALFDLMETAETVFFRKDFFESEVVSHNFAAFCTFVADRLTQNMFTPLTSDKKVFLFLLHILERLDVASQATQELISAIDKAANPSEAATLSRSSKAAAAAALQRNKGFRQDFAAVFGAMNRVIVSILQRGQSYKSRAMELFVVEKVIDKERVLLSAANTDADFVRALMWYVYSMLSSQDEPLKKAAFGALRLILAIRGDLAQEAFIYKNAKDETVDLFTNGIDLIFQTDFHSFESWLKLHKEVIDQAVERRALTAAKAWTEAAAKSAAEAQRVSHQRDADKARTAEREAHKFGTECKQFFGGLTEWASKVDFAEARHFLSWMWDEQDRQDYIAGVWGKTDWFMKTQKCGVWREPSCFERQKWRLDFTEAAFRMRMKLERDFQFYRRYPYVPLEKPGDRSDNSRAPISSDSKAWYEKYSGKTGNTTCEENNKSGSASTDSKTGDPLVNNGDNDNNNDNNNNDKINDDNKVNDNETVYDDVPTRKIRRFLDPSDPIEEYFNCERAESMDTHPGVIVFCRSSIYIVEGFAVQAVGNDARVIVDLTLESGKKSQTNTMQAQQSYYVGAAAVTTADPHPWRKWSHREIRKVIPRRYVLRWIALEIFISDGQNHLLVFDPSDVEHIRRTFGRIAKAALGSFYSVTGTHFGQVQDVGSGGGSSSNSGSGAINTNSGGSVIIGLSGGLDKQARQKELNAMTQQWVEGRLSNFQYLMYLNTMAGRSYNDITQYPVFPWVIADYTSETLDLNNPETFRDLSKPMGALDPARAKIFKKHFNDCMGVCEPYHYSHHYSSAAVVMFFLMRLEPYTNSSLELNGGHWDCPDRQFHNIGDTWRMLSSGTMPQVMELTPEFFYLPEIFVNGGRFLFGVRSDGVPVDDVVLPPWAKGDPREFVRRNMEALESPYVSAHLHEWIDLIFGYKQRGKAAEEALNVFLPESYEGAVDIDAITDDVVRRSKIDMIRNFGQTPQQLWPKTPHPAKSPSVLNPPPPPQWSTPDGTVAPEVVLRTDAGAPVGFIRVVEERRLGKKVVLAAGSSMIPVIVPSDFALFSPSASASSSSSSSSSSSAASGSAVATAGTSQAGSLTGSTGSGGISSSLSASASSLPSASAVEASQAGSESGLGVGSHAVIGSAELGSASSTSYRYICYGHPDRTLRMYTSSTTGSNLSGGGGNNNSGSSSGSSGNNGSSGSGKCTCAWSSGHDGPVTAARASFDGSVLVTGGKDSIVKVFLADPVLGYRQAATNLCGHTAPISAIALSRTQSIIVSGDTRGRCIIWDLNKCTYVRGLPEEEGVEEMEEFVVKDTEAHREDPVVCISVHDITGNIAVCTRRRICIWTVNGCLIAQHQMSSIVAADEITACTFSREWIPGRGQTLVTGHAQGAVHVWDMETFVPRQAPAPPEIRLKRSFQVPGDPAPVTALYVSIPKSLPFGKSKLYVGNSLGSVFYYKEVGRRKKVF